MESKYSEIEVIAPQSRAYRLQGTSSAKGKRMCICGHIPLNGINQDMLKPSLGILLRPCELKEYHTVIDPE